MASCDHQLLTEVLAALLHPKIIVCSGKPSLISPKLQSNLLASQSAALITERVTPYCLTIRAERNVSGKSLHNIK